MEKLSLGVLIGASIASQFTSVVGMAGRQLAGLGKITQELSSKQLKLAGLDKASQQAKAASADFFAAKQRVQELQRALDTAGRTGDPAGLKKIRQDLAGAEVALQKAKRAMDGQMEAVQRSKSAVEAAGYAVLNYKGQLASVSAELEKATARQKRFSDAAAAKERYSAAAGNMRSTAMQVGAAGVGVVSGLIAPAMKFEDAMLGVAKQVDGARDSNGRLTATYFDMGREIQSMGRRIPMATNEIAMLVTQAARMGIQGKDNLIAFTNTTAKMSTAFEMPAEEIGDQMGKIAQLFKIPAKGIERLGDSINYLDDNAISKGKDIIEVMQRMAGSAATLGMSAPQTAALASTFLSLGESAERAGTAGEGMMRQLNIAKMNPKKFHVGAKMIGMTAMELQKGMAKDAQGTIMKVLEKIKGVPKEKQMEVVTRLFGKDWGGAIAKLANNVDEYKRQIELATGKKGVGSMQREFEARQQTTSAHWQIFKNGVTEVAVSLGAVLLPALNSVMSVIKPVMAEFATFSQNNPALIKSLIGIGAGLATLALGSRSVSLVTAAFSALRLAMLSNPLGLVLVGIAAAAGLIIANWGTIGPWISGVWSSIVSTVTAAWRGLFWYLGGIWSQITAAFSTVIAGLTSLIINWSPLGLFYQAFAGVLSWFGVTLPATLTGYGAMMIQGLINGITSQWAVLKATMSGLADSVIGIARRVLGIRSPSRVFMEIGRFLADGASLGILRGTPRAIAAAGALAMGVSAAWADSTGPAIATGASSADPPLRAVGGMRGSVGAAAMAASGGGSAQAGTVHYHINVYQQQGEDGEAFARRVVALLDQHSGKRRRAALGDWHGGD